MRNGFMARWCCPARIPGWLRNCASAFVLASIFLDAGARAGELDLDDKDGLNTTTIAKRQNDIEWLNAKEFGAETVAGRNRQFVKPEGIRAGNYIVSPEAGAVVIFDDNIYGTDAEKVSDIRSELDASVKFQSQLPRHALDFSLDGKIVSFAENSDQDFANIRGRLDGALHFDHAHTLAAGVLSSLTHQERNSPSYPTAARGPVEVFYNRAAAGITRDVGRLYGTISAAAESWDFADTTAMDGSHLDLDPRDQQLYSTTLRTGYRFSPGFELVGKVKGLKILNRGDGFSDTDALGYEALAGLAFETSPLLRWRILGGFGVRDYEQAGVEDLAVSLMEAEVQWLPTQRLTIYGSLTRRLNETGGPDGSALLQTGLSVRADYEIYHNLLLNSGFEIREDASLTSNTSEMVYGARIGLEYYLNKNWLFTFAYEHDLRESESDSRDMHRNRFMIGAKLRF
jgi:hypothetical protein